MIARPWMVSVLSTAYDLKEYREDVIKLLRDKKFEVSAYEEPHFPVETDMHSHDSCLVALSRVDIAIVIIDKRSGGTYYNIESGEKKISITEAEYLKAIELGIPIYFFVSQKAYDELHAYKVGYKKFCEKNKYSSEDPDEVRRYKEEYNTGYICTHVEKIQTLLFIDDVQHLHKDHAVSNWMDFFTNRETFLEAVERKLAGYSRKLIHRLARSQSVALLNKHTSTAFGMSLGDVFASAYYIEPPHKIESGKNNVNSSNNLLSDEIKGVLESDNSILIYGEAGYGKTTILAKCFSEQVKELDENPSYTIPLFLPLRNKGNDYHFDIERYIEEELANTEDTTLCHAPYPCLDLRYLKIRFYCDGFDEIAETLSNDDLDRIRKSTIFSYPLVLTCRQQYTMRYLNEFNFADKFGVRIQMEKWSIQTAREYIANFCIKKGICEKDKNSILAVIDGNNDLQQVLDSPLLITMFLWFIENQRSVPISSDISRVELFENWMVELSKREFSKHGINGASSEIVIEVWEFAAWQVYLHRMQSNRLRIDDLLDMLATRFPEFDREYMRSWFDALFDCTTEYIIGTFHEQFMEYLVARLLIGASIAKVEPYPNFLELVLRPEINRYYRDIWRNKSKVVQAKIYDAIAEQYFGNMGKTDNASVKIRVHAIYHLCRLEAEKRTECIERAFNIENNISVLLSLYFGTIKLGQMDNENRFCELLLKDDEYSVANRGYHLAYYADSMGETRFPYKDDNVCGWQGTLQAFERHFGSDEESHYFLRRIDLVTMTQLIEARKKVYPLTEEKLAYFGKRIEDSLYGKMDMYSSYNESIVATYGKLKEVFSTYSKE